MTCEMEVRTTRKLFAVLIWAATCTVLLCCEAATAEDSPAEVFKSRYGRKIRQVKDTTIPSDDLTLAKEILKATDSRKLSDELLTLMIAIYGRAISAAEVAAKYRAVKPTLDARKRKEPTTRPPRGELRRDGRRREEDSAGRPAVFFVGMRRGLPIQ